MTSNPQERPIPRSSRPEVRNPISALPGVREAIAAMPPEARSVMRVVLVGLRADALAKARKSWSKSKNPMDYYHKVVAIYAGHITRLLR